MQPGWQASPNNQNSSSQPRENTAGQSRTPRIDTANATDFELPVLPDYPPPSATQAANGTPAAPRTTPSLLGRAPITVSTPESTLPRSSANAEAASAPSRPAASLNIARRLSATAAGATTSGGMPVSQQDLASRPRPSAANAGASQPEPLAPRTPTLTARMRAVQPPDVARQAVSELGVLARELDVLPERIETSGLARVHQHRYLEAAQSYLDLACLAWTEVAGERLEQGGAELDYRQRAITVARRIMQLQNECAAATNTKEFLLPRKTPLLWRRRTSLVREGLSAWQRRLASTPDPREMGQGLFLLRGYLGLASAGTFPLVLLDLLVSATVLFTTFLALGCVLLLATAVVNGDPLTATSFAIAALALGLTLLFVLLLALNGPVPLGLLLGAAAYSPDRSTRNARDGAPIIALALRIWWLLTGTIGALALLAALAMGGLLLNMYGPIPQPAMLVDWLSLIGSRLTLALAPVTLTSLAALLLLGLPVLVVTLIRCAAELASNPVWVLAARRYALEPTLAVLAPVTGALLLSVWFAANAAGWQYLFLLQVNSNAFTWAISLRGVALFLALTLPYLLLLELPYRIGIRRWRRLWLRDLASRRADVESHVRRLSVTDPRSGTQDTSDENLRAMQYDLVLLQFYRDKIAEAERTSSAPYKLPGILLALVTAIVGAALLDSATLIYQLLTPR